MIILFEILSLLLLGALAAMVHFRYRMKVLEHEKWLRRNRTYKTHEEVRQSLREALVEINRGLDPDFHYNSPGPIILIELHRNLLRPGREYTLVPSGVVEMRPGVINGNTGLEVTIEEVHEVLRSYTRHLTGAVPAEKEPEKADSNAWDRLLEEDPNLRHDPYGRDGSLGKGRP